MFLSNKPLHFDEGINGWFALQLQKTGFYVYDPTNFHGPLYFYLLSWWTGLWGPTVEALRSLPGVFSIAGLLLFWRRYPWMSWLLLVSPMCVFYGRSGIHETVFVFFQMLFVLGLWNFKQEEKDVHLFTALVGLWGMLCLKETFVITLATVTVGFLVGGFPWRRFFRSGLPALWFPILFFVLVWALLFSAFGHDYAGLKNFFVAFTPWMKTGAQGAGHEKPFDYWLQMMASTEPLALAGLAASAVGVFRRWRALAIFALLQLFFYSWIPYKTPWCAITVVWPLYLNLALALEEIWKCRFGAKALVGTALVAGLVFQIEQLWISVYRDPIDLNHPLVYVNSTYEFKELNRKIVDEMEKNPSRRNEIIQISLDENWPLPWTLQNSKGLRYDHLRKNFLPEAWIYFCDASDDEILISRLGDKAGKYRRLSVVIRQNTPPVSVWWRED